MSILVEVCGLVACAASLTFVALAMAKDIEKIYKSEYNHHCQLIICVSQIKPTIVKWDYNWSYISLNFTKMSTTILRDYGHHTCHNNVYPEGHVICSSYNNCITNGRLTQCIGPTINTCIQTQCCHTYVVLTCIR